MRYFRTTLVILGAVALMVSAGFFWQMPWAQGLWPLPDGPMSYAFMAAILAGSAIPLVWVGLFGELRALLSYGAGFALMYGGMATYAFLLVLGKPTEPLLVFGIIAVMLTAFCLASAIIASTFPIRDHRPLPRLVHKAFMAEVVVLTGVGVLLILKVPHILPWPLKPESSVMYGWAFLGMGLYFLSPLIYPKWYNAQGQLMGFLAYDLVLLVPLLRLFAQARPEIWLGLVTATGIVLISGVLAIYYLLFDKATRVWTRHTQD